MTQARALAAAQTVPRRGDLAANLEQHLRLVRLAAQEGARLLVFPELSLTGYELDLAEALVFAPGDPRLAPLTEAATAASITLVVGAPVRLGAELQLGAFILSPDGAQALYTKQRLGAFSDGARVDSVDGNSIPPAEATIFSPGSSDPLVPTGNGTAAVAICADTGRAEHAQRAAARGAKTYLASMFVIPSDFEPDMRKLAGYAQQHAMAVVFSNFGGPSGGLASAGRSAIWSERGQPLARLEPAGAGVVVAHEGPKGWRARTLKLAVA